MAYDGWLRFGGTTVVDSALLYELVGSASCACKHHFLKPPCCMSTYSIPGAPQTVEDAPWYDPSDPDLSSRFYGVFGVKMTGMGDTNRQVSVVERTTSGASIGGSRRPSRQTRVTAMLMGKGEDAVDYGLAWLSAALDGDKCGQHGGACGTSDVEFYDSCPPARAIIPEYTEWSEPVYNSALNPSAETVDGTFPIWSNLLTNPRFDAGSGTVEVRRNMWADPMPTGYGLSNGNGRWSQANSSVPVYMFQGWLRAQASATSSDRNVMHGMNWAANSLPVASGATYRLSLEIEHSPGIADASIRRWEYNAANAIVVEQEIPLTYDPATGRSYVQFTTNAATVRIATTIQRQFGTWAVGDYYQVRHTMFELMPHVLTPEFFAPGLPSPDPDLEPVWTGAANLSQSILRGQAVAGLTGTNRAVAVHSSRFGGSMRLIPTDLANPDCYAEVIVPVEARAQFTALGTVHLDAPLTGTLAPRARRLVAFTPEQSSPQAPNAPGSYPLRAVFGPQTSTYRLRFYHGGLRGSGNVYWTKGAIIPGLYDGPYFDGDGIEDTTLTLSDLAVPYSNTVHPGLTILDRAADNPPPWLTDPGTVSIPWNAGRIFWPSGTPVPQPGFPQGAALFPTGGGNPQSVYGQTIVGGVTQFVVCYAAWGDADVTVYIDGQPISADPIISPAGVRYLHISGISTAEHQVHFVVGWGANLVYLAAPTGATFRPHINRRLRIGIMGDSYFDSGIPPYFGGLAREIHRLTGAHVQQLGQGSTGYTNNGASSGDTTKGVYGAPSRLSALEVANVDVLLVGGSVNDGSSAPGYDQIVRTAAGTYYVRVGERIGTDTPIIVLGVEPLNLAGNPPTVWDSINAAVLQAANDAPNVVGVIDWRGESWFTGTGSVCTPMGDGNQDTYVGWSIGGTCADPIHANYQGQRYLAGLMVPRILSLLTGFSIGIPPSPDWSARWTGTPGASTSEIVVQTLKHLSDISDPGNEIGLYRTSEWSEHGGYSGRPILTDLTVVASDVVPNASPFGPDIVDGEPAIAMVTVRNLTTTPRAIGYIDGTGIHTVTTPSEIGVHHLQVTIPAVDRASTMVFVGNFDTDIDVMYDSFGVFPATYAGPYFDGDTPDVLDEFGGALDEYGWLGAPHDSLSVYRTREMTPREQTDDEYEATLDRHRRILHDVATTSGPLEKRRSQRDDCWVVDVEWTWTAGEPHIYTLTRPVELPMTGTSVFEDVIYNLAPFTSAELPGPTVPVAVNYNTNPSLELDAAGWTGIVEGDITSGMLWRNERYQAAAAVQFGTWGWRINYEPPAGSPLPDGAFWAQCSIPLAGVPAGPVSVSIWARNYFSPYEHPPVVARVLWVDSGGAVLQADQLGSFPWQPGLVSGRSIGRSGLIRPAGAVTARVQCGLVFASFPRPSTMGSGDGYSFYFDACSLTVP